ncbi:hypothetical protein BGZ93_006335 [Podila epicladia]|nr:hypothetical protein BGZ93_006335 [Podila epicladia]
MDTAVIKSWNEVLRLTDPVIWNLAMDMDEGHSMGLVNGSVIVNGGNGGNNCLHGNVGQSNGVTHAQLRHSPVTLLPSKDSLSPSPSSSSSSSSSSSTSPSSPSYHHFTSNYCRSLLDPHPKNALDWLKCLVIQTTDDRDRDRDSSHETQKQELRSLLSRTSVDLGPAGAAITKRTGVPMSTSTSLSYNQGAAERIAGSPSGTRPASTTASTPSSTPNQTRTRRVSHAKPTTTALSDTSIPAEEPTYTQALTSATPHSSVETNPAKQGLVSHSSISPPASVTDYESDSTSRPSSNVDLANRINPSESGTQTSPTSSISTKASGGERGGGGGGGGGGVVVSTSNPAGASALMHAAGLAIQQQLIQSKNATVAFFYRTFSPMYRFSNLYIDSWSNGSQLRGLDKIKTSFVRGDAFTLVRNTTAQMRDVWNQVLAARASQKKVSKRQKELKAAKRDADAAAPAAEKKRKDN